MPNTMQMFYLNKSPLVGILSNNHLSQTSDTEQSNATLERQNLQITKAHAIFYGVVFFLAVMVSISTGNSEFLYFQF